ncbi:hypothetical protein BJV77DRAFT_1072007 [Russula vinacea]|nr:hypothetical protein BJV77DRAFT_1072007 [Russula vinacea]
MALVVNTITYALVNSRKTEWDAVRFADKAKNTKVTKSGREAEADRSLRRHFHAAHFKDLMEPTTILDRHGKVIVWALPGILHPNRLEDYNKASKGLSKALNKSIKKKSKKWRYANFKVPEDPVEFTPGIVDFSPGWFMQRQDGLTDEVHVSTELRTPAAVKFFHDVQKVEEILNCIGILACPDLFSTGMASIDKLKRGEDLHKWHDNVKIWPSFFSGIEVIANRHTPSHRDVQGDTQMDG